MIRVEAVILVTKLRDSDTQGKSGEGGEVVLSFKELGIGRDLTSLL